MEPWVIPLAALLVSIATFLFAAWSQTKTAKRVYVEDMERRIATLEAEIVKLNDEVADCEREKREMNKQIFDLLTENRRTRKLLAKARGYDSDAELPNDDE